jgi:hypothetical protein
MNGRVDLGREKTKGIEILLPYFTLDLLSNVYKCILVIQRRVEYATGNDIIHRANYYKID